MMWIAVGLVAVVGGAPGLPTRADVERLAAAVRLVAEGPRRGLATDIAGDRGAGGPGPADEVADVLSTAGGRCFHRAGCASAAGAVARSSRTEATARGLVACRRCLGPPGARRRRREPEVHDRTEVGGGLPARTGSRASPGGIPSPADSAPATGQTTAPRMAPREESSPAVNRPWDRPDGAQNEIAPAVREPPP